MKRLITRILIKCGIHGIRHRDAIYKLCAELDFK